MVCHRPVQPCYFIVSRLQPLLDVQLLRPLHFSSRIVKQGFYPNCHLLLVLVVQRRFPQQGDGLLVECKKRPEKIGFDGGKIWLRLLCHRGSPSYRWSSQYVRIASASCSSTRSRARWAAT